MRRLLPLALVVLLATGCPDPDPANPTPTPDGPVETFIFDQVPLDLTLREHTQRAMFISHPAVPLQLMLLIVFASDISGSQSGCPVIVDTSAGDAINITYDGGCTNDLGTPETTDDFIFAGSMVVAGDQDDFVVTATNYNFITNEQCNSIQYPVHQGIDGTVGLRAVSGEDIEFEVEAIFRNEGIDSQGSCIPRNETVAMVADITQIRSGIDSDNDGQLDDTEFAGSGSFGSESLGRWQMDAALTHSEVDNVTGPATDSCDEPTAGRLDLSSESHVATLYADGARNCTVQSCSPWTLDGTLQPDLMCGVGACTIARAPSSSRAPALLLVLLGLVAALRRRR